MRKSFLVALAVLGCEQAAPVGRTDPKTLEKTLMDLAAFGEKHVGTDGAARAASYLSSRMKAIGLSDVHDETFQIPRHDLLSSSLVITIDGAATPMEFDVFEASGSGSIDAEVVFAGTAHPEEIAAVDVSNKVALVVRDPAYHRSAQYKNLTDAGARAMLYVSQAPGNLIQVGSVRFDWEGAGTIPAITVGGEDGQKLRDAITAKKTVRAVVDVQARITPAIGRNVVGRIVGERPEMIVIGAHYDTWFIGATDNGGGVAELLGLAERRIKRGKPRYTLVFVAYDGEEVALYGGYDFLRKHRVMAEEPILTVINFEIPSAKNASLIGLGRSNQPFLDKVLLDSGLGFLYPLYTGLELVAELLGGIIPTDIQGIYRSGVPTVSTAATSPYYHTVEDTPDKVDFAMLAESTDGFDDALQMMMKGEPLDFGVLDEKIWRAQAVVAPRAAGEAISVEFTVTDGEGTAAAGAPARAVLMVDDFFFAAELKGAATANGRVSFNFPASAAAMGSGARFIHFSAGVTYPLVERVLAVK